MATTMPSMKRIDVFNLRLEDISITDIAHNLANRCRWGGATTPFYSVAEHCYRGCLYATNPLLSMAFLLHDAAEAYLFDAQRPIKAGLGWMRDGEFIPYEVAEDRILKLVAE